jgi:hypothetical protein
LQRAAVHNWTCPAVPDEDELDLPGYTPSARWRHVRGAGIATEDPLGKPPNQARSRSSPPCALF